MIVIIIKVILPAISLTQFPIFNPLFITPVRTWVSKLYRSSNTPSFCICVMCWLSRAVSDSWRQIETSHFEIIRGLWWDPSGGGSLGLQDLAFWGGGTAVWLHLCATISSVLLDLLPHFMQVIMHFPRPGVILMGAGLLFCWIGPDCAGADEIPPRLYAVVGGRICCFWTYW